MLSYFYDEAFPRIKLASHLSPIYLLQLSTSNSIATYSLCIGSDSPNKESWMYLIILIFAEYSYNCIILSNRIVTLQWEYSLIKMF